MTNVKQFGIIQIEKWKPKTVATMIHKQYYEIKSQTCEPYLLQQTAHFFFICAIIVFKIAQANLKMVHIAAISDKVICINSLREVISRQGLYIRVHSAHAG